MSSKLEQTTHSEAYIQTLKIGQVLVKISKTSSCGLDLA